MRKKQLALSVLLAALLAPGCARMTYTYDNQKYYSSNEALAAQSTKLKKITDEIAVITPQLNGTALLLTPSKETLAAVGVNITGTPKQESIDYIVNLLYADYSTFEQYLTASQAFKHVEHRVVDSPLKESRVATNDYLATIYLHKISPTQGSWYLIAPGLSEPVQIRMDTAAAPGASRINAWVGDVVKAAKNAQKK